MAERLCERLKPVQVRWVRVVVGNRDSLLQPFGFGLRLELGKGLRVQLQRSGLSMDRLHFLLAVATPDVARLLL